MICLKIRTFVVSATTLINFLSTSYQLWFAWKFVPLWYQQQHCCCKGTKGFSCDLLENSYLCGISNNSLTRMKIFIIVVICLKIRTFVVSATTIRNRLYQYFSCDLLENSYLCGISNNLPEIMLHILSVVICLKIRTFVVSATTTSAKRLTTSTLWFAWKFVPLWYQQQQITGKSNSN